MDKKKEDKFWGLLMIALFVAVGGIIIWQLIYPYLNYEKTKERFSKRAAENFSEEFRQPLFSDDEERLQEEEAGGRSIVTGDSATIRSRMKIEARNRINREKNIIRLLEMGWSQEEIDKHMNGKMKSAEENLGHFGTKNKKK